MLFQAEFASDIEQTKDANRRIDQQAADINAGIAHLALQSAIDTNPGVADIAEEVANPSLDRQRRDIVVHLRDRLGGISIDHFID